MLEKIDSEYRDDSDYLPELIKFNKKEMLLLSLYQEWVKRRYSKPDTKRTFGASLFGTLLAVLTLTWKLKEDPVVFTIMMISSLMIFLSLINIYREFKNEENHEITKLNAIRFAIKELSKK